jgi:hypothetical protein
MRQCSSSLALMLTCHPQLLLMKLTKRYLLGSNKQSGGGRTQKYEIWNTKKKAAQTGGNPTKCTQHLRKPASLVRNWMSWRRWVCSVYPSRLLLISCGLCHQAAFDTITLILVRIRASAVEALAGHLRRILEIGSAWCTPMIYLNLKV